MAWYSYSEECDTLDITSERKKFDEVYKYYSDLLTGVFYIENFESLLMALRTDEDVDVNVREDVSRRIENDICDGIITKPTRSLDEVV